MIPIAIEDAACPPGGGLHETGEVLMGIESGFKSFFMQEVGLKMG